MIPKTITLLAVRMERLVTDGPYLCPLLYTLCRRYGTKGFRETGNGYYVADNTSGFFTYRFKDTTSVIRPAWNFIEGHSLERVQHLFTEALPSLSPFQTWPMFFPEGAHNFLKRWSKKPDLTITHKSVDIEYSSLQHYITPLFPVTTKTGILVYNRKTSTLISLPYDVKLAITELSQETSTSFYKKYKNVMSDPDNYITYQ